MKPFDLLNYNTTSKNIKANFKIDTPRAMQTGLNKKQMRVTKFYLNNQFIPQFIPEPILNASLFNLNIQNATYYNNALTINSINYYVVLKNKATSARSVIFLSHSTDSDAPVPLFPANDLSAYYNDPYYYYYDFKHFLTIIEKAINTVLANNYCTFNVDNNGMIQLLMNVAFFTLYDLEFSDTLLNILPFKSYKNDDPKTKTLVFGSLQVLNNNASYYVTSAQQYDNIFPFIELLLVGEKTCINGTKFFTNLHNADQINDEMYKHVLLAYNISTNQPMQIYNFYEYFNTYEYAVLDFEQDKNPNATIELNIWLRMKNNIMIQHYIKPNERFSLTFQIENK